MRVNDEIHLRVSDKPFFRGVLAISRRKIKDFGLPPQLFTGTSIRADKGSMLMGDSYVG